MKTLLPVLLACAVAIPSLAQEVKTNAAPAQTSTNQSVQPVVTLQMSAGQISAPLVLTNGYISQPETTDVESGGKAVFNFTIPTPGNYVLKGMVNAEDDSSNSFYLNIDAQPEDPLTIWDFEVTQGFEERPVSWRGNGDGSNDEFNPKVFKLSAGAHKLNVAGREPAQLKSISIYPAGK
jgi:hypothetical protein